MNDGKKKCTDPLRFQLQGPGFESRRLVEGEARWEAPDHPQSVLPQNWGGTEQNRTVSCMVLKAKANDRRKNKALSRDEFLGP
ncbi:hypothetical protein TNCV_2061181 [Trichonephila clavipes]|nr:hypothetical protein TNCV_2061181 [Trichonephila clavipes]